jgi:O-6-methylguanine DNA methyltransferase
MIPTVQRDVPMMPVLALSVATPIGRLRLAATAKDLVRLELPGPTAELRMRVWLALRFPDATVRSGVNPILRKAAAQLQAYFTAGLREFSLPLDLAGTSFQQDVWNAVASIPFGETRTYRDIAEVIGRPRAVRAVGAAQAANPLPLIIPCHRVIGSDGSLTGYGGGTDTKRWLLDHETDVVNRAAPALPRRLPGFGATSPAVRPLRPRPTGARPA